MYEACRDNSILNWKEKILPSSLFYLFHSLLSWHRSPRPTVFSLDQSYLGKQVTAALCVYVSVCVVMVSPHMLALTCWRAGL